jgi:mRNA-degrading endonuclease RelE of RelBE toxin-antitoxin system
MPNQAISLVGQKGIMRIRIGDYRVLYEIKKKEGIVLISRIDKRSRVYQ